MQLIAARRLVQVDKGKANLRVMNPTYSKSRFTLVQFLRLWYGLMNKMYFPLSRPKLPPLIVQTLRNQNWTLICQLQILPLNKNQCFWISCINTKTLSQLPSVTFAEQTATNIELIPCQNLTEIDRQVQELLQNDIIDPSNSEWHSPVLLVRKPTGEYRFVVDYRKPNKSTMPMSFPLP